MQAVHDVAFGRRMMEIKLEPSLSSCIETVAKREYERVLSLLLRGKHEDRQLGEELELRECSWKQLTLANCGAAQKSSCSLAGA